MLKFRSMSGDAETRGAGHGYSGDPRVTRVGAVIRRTRIDELPQLVNVLRGEMRLIGSRPDVRISPTGWPSGAAVPRVPRVSRG